VYKFQLWQYACLDRQMRIWRHQRSTYEYTCMKIQISEYFGLKKDQNLVASATDENAATWVQPHTGFVGHDSMICNWFMCVPWLINMCVMTHLWVCHDSFMCVAWIWQHQCRQHDTYTWKSTYDLGIPNKVHENVAISV